MKKSKVVKTGMANPRGLPGMSLSDESHLDGPKTGFEFETRLRADVAAKREQVEKIGWQHLANGLTVPADLIASVCTHCHALVWVKPEMATGDCPQCYHAQSAPAYQKRPATGEEVAAWNKKETDARARHEAEGPLRRAALAAFNLRKRQDAGETSVPDDPTMSHGRA